jgi:16S rRNA (cytosine967-C5)-methyltransferase
MPAQSQQTVSPARSAAFDILLRVEREDSYASELLHSRMLDKLSPQDRGLTMEIVMGVLRWRSRLDAAIAQFSFTPFHRLDFEVLTALRIGAYQLEFLSGIPNRAAVNESVMLVKRAKKKSAAAMVNVILRKIASSVAQRRAAINEFDPERAGEPMRSSGPLVNRALAGEDAPHFLARQYSHPEWLVARWIGEYGVSAAAQICAANQQVPPTAVRLRERAFTAEDAKDAKQGKLGRVEKPDEAEVSQENNRDSASAQVALAPGRILHSARVVTDGDITHSEACREGRIAIQDEGSQLIAALVCLGEKGASDVDTTAGQRTGGRILDCCAAPGGKTSAIADRLPTSKIIAVDLHEHRARLMRQLVRQPNIEIITADATSLDIPGEFDRILVDVPCSGTGTLARNPEIKWKLKPDDLADLHRRQVAILSAMLDRLAPGGRLVYSSCSLEHEENEEVVEEALRERGAIRLTPVTALLEQLAADGELAWDDLESLTRGPYLRTIPGVHPCDGFFAAIIERL